MNTTQTVGAAILAACVVLLVYTEIQKRIIFARYEKHFESGDFEACVRLLSRPVARLVYPRYNRCYMLLNAQICLNDAAGALRTIDEMLSLKATAEQRMALLMRAFTFFIEQEDYGRAANLLAEIREKGEGPVVEECERTYAIHAQKSFAYIRQMEDRLKSATGSERTTLCYLLSLQYENKGDRDAAERYLALVQEAFSDADAGAPASRDGQAR